MKIKNGALKLNSADVKEFMTMIEHSERDLSYMEGGTFVNISNDEFDKRSAKKVIKAIEKLKIILEIAK